jgi:hypothetical protein
MYPVRPKITMLEQQEVPFLKEGEALGGNIRDSDY